MWNPRLSSLFPTALLGALFLSANPASGLDSWILTGKPSGWIVGGKSNPSVYEIVASGPDLFASGYDKIYRSRDSGATWVVLNTGFDSYRVNNLLAWQVMIFVSTPKGVYRTLDSGTTWSKTGQALQSQYVSTLTSAQGSLFAMGDSLPWVSTDSGSTWKSIPINVKTTVRGLYPIDGVIYAATTQEFYRSLDGGLTWKLAPLPANSRSPLLYVPFDNKVFATTLGSLVVSGDLGGSWTELEIEPSTSPWVLSIQPTKRALFTGTYKNGVYRSDRGVSWVQSGIEGGRVGAMTTFGDRLFASEIDNWMYWTRLPEGTSVQPRATQATKGPSIRRDASGAWLLDVELAHSTGVRVFRIDPSGRVEKPLWSGRLEAGMNTVPLGSVFDRTGATLVGFRSDDGQFLCIPSRFVP